MALADMISMVKHAADQKYPLLTAEERVDAAIQRFLEDKDLSDQQLEWLKRIRTHLVQNLSIDKDDFDVVPIFARNGGWGRANKTFDDQLAPMLDELNEAVAA